MKTNTNALVEIEAQDSETSLKEALKFVEEADFIMVSKTLKCIKYYDWVQQLHKTFPILNLTKDQKIQLLRSVANHNITFTNNKTQDVRVQINKLKNEINCLK